jgi:hypothetical protein
MILTVVLTIFLVQADFPICPAVNFSGYPACDFQNGQFYVFWIDQRTSPNMAIYGARIARDGTVLDPSGIQVYNDSAGYSCNAAFDGSNFLVVTRNHC